MRCFPYMKTFAFFVNSSCFLGMLLGASAQTPTVSTTSSQNPAKTAAQTANRRAANYKGPKVVKDTKALGREMLRDSKPTPAAKPVAPVRQ